MCDRWLHSFENFLLDLGERPHLSFTLERENNDVGYEPGNCFWASPRQQANNRSNNVKFLFRNEMLTIAQIAESESVRRDMLGRLLTKGLPLDQALAKLKLGQKKKSKMDDHPQTVHYSAKDVWGTQTAEGEVHIPVHHTESVTVIAVAK